VNTRIRRPSGRSAAAPTAALLAVLPMLAMLTMLVGLLAAARPAAAQDDEAARARIRSREIERFLQDGKPVKASRAARRAVEDLVPTLVGGADDAATLGNLLLLEAVAESALDNNADALWLWAVAQSIDPSLTDVDLSRFGVPGRLLAERRLRERAKDGQLATDVGANRPGVFESASAAEPPRVAKLPDPDYPAAARDAGLRGAVIVQVMVDRQGRPRNPLVAEAPAAVLAYAATEAVRGARFEPARLNGNTVSVYYDLRLDFQP
jgi:TonB family protein